MDPIEVQRFRLCYGAQEYGEGRRKKRRAADLLAAAEPFLLSLLDAGHFHGRTRSQNQLTYVSFILNGYRQYTLDPGKWEGVMQVGGKSIWTVGQIVSPGGGIRLSRQIHYHSH